MNDYHKDILLYWTGEADVHTMHRARTHLENNESARVYLNELQELASAVKKNQNNGTMDNPLSHRVDLLDEVLEEFDQQEPKVPHKSSLSWRLPFGSIAAVAAVIAIVTVSDFRLLRRDSSSRQELAPPPSQVRENSSRLPSSKQMTLSERIRTQPKSFRQSGRGLEELRNNRERRKKFRSNQFEL